MYHEYTVTVKVARMEKDERGRSVRVEKEESFDSVIAKFPDAATQFALTAASYGALSVRHVLTTLNVN